MDVYLIFYRLSVKLKNGDKRISVWVLIFLLDLCVCV